MQKFACNQDGSRSFVRFLKQFSFSKSMFHLEVLSKFSKPCIFTGEIARMQESLESDIFMDESSTAGEIAFENPPILR